MALIRITSPVPGSQFNPYRKAWHTLGLVVPIAFYTNVFGFFGTPGRAIGLIVLVAATILLILVDALRFAVPAFNRLFVRYLGFVLKEEEATGRFNATVPYFLANLVLFLYCTPTAAMLGCGLLMIGDPFAAYMGSRFGRVRFWNGKSLEGLAAFAVSGTIACVLFLIAHSALSGPGGVLSVSGPSAFKVIVLVGLTGLAAAVAEFFSGNAFFGLLDDNLMVPLVSVLALLLFSRLLGLPSEWIFDPMPGWPLSP